MMWWARVGEMAERDANEHVEVGAVEEVVGGACGEQVRDELPQAVPVREPPGRRIRQPPVLVERVGAAIQPVEQEAGQTGALLGAHARHRTHHRVHASLLCRPSGSAREYGYMRIEERTRA